jgi:hypothetical protein
MNEQKTALLHMTTIGPAFQYFLDVYGYCKAKQEGKNQAWPAAFLGVELSPDDFAAELRAIEAIRDDQMLSFINEGFALPLCERIPTIFCCRTNHPAVALAAAVCMATGMDADDLLKGDMNMKQWKGLGNFCDLSLKFGDAPLLMLDATEPATLHSTLQNTKEICSGTVILCDWPLEGAELQLAKQLASEKSVRVVWPES